MKMRLSLAIALSHNAELVIMDEPSSGLDPVIRHDLMSVIAEEIERRECTFLVSTHITSDLDRIADYVVVMLDGRIVLNMSREQITDRYAVCKGGLDLLANGTRELFLGVNRSAYGFTALTADRARVSATLGDTVVVEPPTIEDLVVHLNREHCDESTLR
jgi:ABC-2 type transport system ATP-binding protein